MEKESTKKIEKNLDLELGVAKIWYEFMAGYEPNFIKNKNLTNEDFGNFVEQVRKRKIELENDNHDSIVNPTRVLEVVFLEFLLRDFLVNQFSSDIECQNNPEEEKRRKNNIYVNSQLAESIRNLSEPSSYVNFFNKIMKTLDRHTSNIIIKSEEAKLDVTLVCLARIKLLEKINFKFFNERYQDNKFYDTYSKDLKNKKSIFSKKDLDNHAIVVANNFDYRITKNFVQDIVDVLKESIESSKAKNFGLVSAFFRDTSFSDQQIKIREQALNGLKKAEKADDFISVLEKACQESNNLNIENLSNKNVTMLPNNSFDEEVKKSLIEKGAYGTDTHRMLHQLLNYAKNQNKMMKFIPIKEVEKDNDSAVKQYGTL